jgi:dolichyl-phosphate-mannose-protein mannosyltransferase
LLVVSLILRLLWLDKPPGALIFDEKYYVNVARNILGLAHDPEVYSDATPGLDPNREHPFLGKGIVAFSMFVLGDNAWGWRIPSVIAGTVALFTFYLLAKRLSRKDELALFASSLFAFSNLIYVHSRIATLDIFMLSFMLLSFYLYLAGRIYLSAVSLALATLCKISGLYGLLTIVTFHYASIFVTSRRLGERPSWRTLLDWFEKYFVTYALSGLVLLTIFDRIWVGYNNPLNHIAFIYNYYAALARAAPQGIESYPWQWLINEVKIPYLTTNVDVRVDGKLISSRPSIAFQGVMNPVIICLTIPTVVYSAYAAYRKGDSTALFVLAWFGATYLPYYPMSIIGHRIMYLFYFLPALPSVCLAIAYLFRDRRVDRWVMLSYLFSVIVGFVALFPFRQIP